MDLSLEAIKLPAWDPASASEWDEAFEKVENYLRACRVASRLHRARLTALILQRAIERRAATFQALEKPALATLAIEEARELIALWLANLLPGQATEQPFTLAEGFLALYLCDAPMRWPGAFLNPQQAPPDLADTLRSRLVKTGPELEVSSMVPRPMDFGLLPDLAGSAMDTFERLPILRTLLAWLLYAAVLIGLFWYTRHH
ncbi:MAG: hypothetical protein EPN23_05640 [Verrucomicrobia bacterium]|nr:MAG: hypothetical protein EPN23_05640 [Verrucomicrobiota bacterium]